MRTLLFKRATARRRRRSPFPVTNAAREEARKATRSAISAGVAQPAQRHFPRPASRRHADLFSAILRAHVPPSNRMLPGATALMRIPSSASGRASPRTVAFKRGLRSRIGHGRAERGKPADRGNADDRAIAVAAPHNRPRRLDHVGRGEQVDVQHPFPLRRPFPRPAVPRRRYRRCKPECRSRPIAFRHRSPALARRQDR